MCVCVSVCVCVFVCVCVCVYTSLDEKISSLKFNFFQILKFLILHEHMYPANQLYMCSKVDMSRWILDDSGPIWNK